MADAVKSKRRYRSTRRDLQARQTRAAILDAAQSLFGEKGWAATTIALIAETAGVAPETVYARFGNKRAIVQALVRRAMRGSDEDTPFMEQAGRQKVRASIGALEKIEAFARDIGEVLTRVAPILAVVRVAAETDPQMRMLYAELHAGRRKNLAAFVAGLASAGELRAGLDAETATDHIWSMASPELFLLVTGVGAKSHDNYVAWLADTLKRLLVEDA